MQVAWKVTLIGRIGSEGCALGGAVGIGHAFGLWGRVFRTAVVLWGMEFPPPPLPTNDMASLTPCASSLDAIPSARPHSC